MGDDSGEGQRKEEKWLELCNEAGRAANCVSHSKYPRYEIHITLSLVDDMFECVLTIVVSLRPCCNKWDNKLLSITQI